MTDRHAATLLYMIPTSRVTEQGPHCASAGVCRCFRLQHMHVTARASYVICAGPVCGHKAQSTVANQQQGRVSLKPFLQQCNGTWQLCRFQRSMAGVSVQEQDDHARVWKIQACLVRHLALHTTLHMVLLSYCCIPCSMVPAWKICQLLVSGGHKPGC